MYAQTYDLSFLKNVLGGVPRIKDWVEKRKKPRLVLALMEEEEWKTYKQNRLFHSLLTTFWESGCSSYSSYDDMRLCYKRMAGLVKNKEGRIVEGSWSEAKKDQAKFAIDSLLREMDMSCVISSSQGKKYEQILRGINAL